MVSDELGKQLHNRATRGEALSTEEQAQLDAWYAEQDRVEAVLLQRTASSVSQTSLQTEIDSILHQITSAAQRIQDIAHQNELLRDEIARFRRQLLQQATVQVA